MQCMVLNINYFIPYSICKFAHSHRNKVFNFNGERQNIKQRFGKSLLMI